MTNQELIENILESHGIIISHVHNHTALIVKRDGWCTHYLSVFWEPCHAEFWQGGGKIWEFPWSDLLDPSWNEKTFIEEFIKHIKRRKHYDKSGIH